MHIPTLAARHSVLGLVSLLITLLRPAVAANAPEPYTETMPGTLVSFEMVPVPAGTMTSSSGGAPVKVGPFWIGKTEVTWDAYDIFVFRLDLTEQQKAEGVDATARP